MENKNQMPLGTWEKITTTENGESIKFEVNIAQRVIILKDNPDERVGKDGGVYYEFQVEQDKKKRVIQTSAWTLLRELKKIGLKAGMVLDITKKMDKGKQFFVVSEVK